MFSFIYLLNSIIINFKKDNSYTGEVTRFHHGRDHGRLSFSLMKRSSGYTTVYWNQLHLK